MEKCRDECFCKPGYFPSCGNGLPHWVAAFTVAFTMKFLKPSALMGTLGSIVSPWPCTDCRCPVGTKCRTSLKMAAGHVVDSNMLCAQSLAVEFMTYNGCNFDFNVRKCCVLSQMCEELNSVPALFIHLAQLHLIFYQLEVKKGTEPEGGR